MTVDIFSLNGQISVTGSCELVVAPDVCTFEVTIYATKQTATASEQSVKRRSDYARQEIKNILSRVSSKNVNLFPRTQLLMNVLIVKHQKMDTLQPGSSLFYEKM